MKALGERHSDRVWAASHPERTPRPSNALGPAPIAREYEHQRPRPKMLRQNKRAPLEPTPEISHRSGGRRQDRKRCLARATLPGHQPVDRFWPIRTCAQSPDRFGGIGDEAIFAKTRKRRVDRVSRGQDGRPIRLHRNCCKFPLSGLSARSRGSLCPRGIACPQT